MTVTELIYAADLRDPLDRAMLADAMDDAGRDGEARLLRSDNKVVRCRDHESHRYIGHAISAVIHGKPQEA